MTELARVKYRDTTIEYVVRRSRRRKKTVELSVRGDDVLVAAPWRISNKRLREFVLSRADWIIERLDEERSRQEQELHFVSGETLPYMGRNVTLVVEPSDVRAPSVKFSHWKFLISTPRELTDDARCEGIREVLADWYKARASVHIPEGVDQWWDRLGKGSRSRILIGDQKRRWGSCSTDGTLRFSWRVMTLEPSLIEYVVVHELAHLTHHNHSADYWALVKKMLPDVQERRDRIREAGRRLPM